MSVQTAWGEQLRLYREQAGFSVTKIADLLSELSNKALSDNLIYQYETNRRIPKQRKRHLLLLTIFIDANVINEPEEANQWLEMGGMGQLSTKEQMRFFPNLVHSLVPMQRPFRNPNFIGREKQIEELESQLQLGKVVTICGPGGIGKTDVTIELLWQLFPEKKPNPQFIDGIVFFSFYDENSIEQATSHIIKSYLPHSEQRSLNSLNRLLSQKKALIVLDGVEVTEQLPSLLQNLGNCGALLTSRRYQDSPDVTLTLKPFSPDEAITLLSKYIVIENQTAAEEVCSIVGNLPLALTIIGGYLRSTGESLEKYLDWLRTNPIQATNPYQIVKKKLNIPHLIAHSINQLNPVVHQIMAIVGVLAMPPFPIKLVEGVLGKEVRPYINQLINYNLLKRDKENIQVAHALIYHYAKESFIPSNILCNRVIHEFDVKNPELKAVDKKNHMLAMINHCYRQKTWAILFQAIERFDPFLSDQGFWDDRLQILSWGLEGTSITRNKQEEISFQRRRGITVGHLGKNSQALKIHQENLKRIHDLKQKESEIETLISIGATLRNMGNFEEALSIFQEILAKSQISQNHHHKRHALSYLGMILGDLGRTDESLTYRQQSIQLARQLNDERGQMYGLVNHGVYYNVIGQTHLGKPLYEEALGISRRLGDKRSESIILSNVGAVYQHLGLLDEALAMHQQALKISQEIGNRRRQSHYFFEMGTIYQELGDIKQAIAYFQQGIEVNKEVGDIRGEAMGLGYLGSALLNLNQPQRAIIFLDQSLKVAKEVGAKRSECPIYGFLGIAQRELKNFILSEKYFEMAIELAVKAKTEREESQWRGQLGITMRSLKQFGKAEKFIKHALAISNELEDKRFVSFWSGELGLLYLDIGQKEEGKLLIESALKMSPPFQHIGYKHSWEKALSAID